MIDKSTKVKPFNRQNKKKEVRILFTTAQCLIGGAPYPGIPLLIDPTTNQVIEVASDWLRYLLVKRSEAISSVRQFAYHLKYWWQFLNRSGLTWDQVDDATLMTWRDKHLKALEPATVNAYLSTVFRMYLWAEKNCYVKGLIGEPDLTNDIHPQLSVDVKLDRRGTSRYVCPLLRKTIPRPVLPTPTHEDITTIHEALADQFGHKLELMIRNTLILSWAEADGVRRMEALSLKVEQIPGWDQIQRLEDNDEKYEIVITGKRRKRRSLWVGADLLAQTREYIENERQRIIDRWRKRLGSLYKNPDGIFLSLKTGTTLCADTISQICAIAFRNASVKGSMHRVRARFATDLSENAVEKELERFGTIPDAVSVLLPVAQRLGHTQVETLFSYLAIAKKRLLCQTVAERTANLNERAISAERRTTSSLARLRYSKVILRLDEAISSGHTPDVLNAIRDVCESQQIDVSRILPARS